MYRPKKKLQQKQKNEKTMFEGGTNFLKEDNACYTHKESCKAKQGGKFVRKT